MGKSNKKSSVGAAPAAVAVPEGKSVKKGKAFDRSIVALE
jgi:nucleolin